MKRGGPLKRKSPLKRSVFVSKRKKPDIPASVRKAVHERSEGICEALTPVCNGRAEHLHHIVRRSQGGEHVASNLIHVSSDCHQYIHANIAWAKKHGFLA